MEVKRAALYLLMIQEKQEDVKTMYDILNKVYEMGKECIVTLIKMNQINDF